MRLFESVISTLNGGPSLTESLGLAPTDLVVVETDGTLEQVDSLKSAYEGAAFTGFDVFSHTFDEVAAHPGVRARQLDLAGVGEKCRECPVVRSCGGGLYTHRYRAGSFDQESVYCADLEALVRGIESRTAAATTSPALTDPGELDAGQQELTRTLLAAVHAELAGRGGDDWARAWELAGAVEQRSDGLDTVLAHPYTRTWLLSCLDALHEGRPGTPGRLAAHVAAAALRGGLDLPVTVAYTGALLHLPTYGALRLPGPAESGRAEVRRAEKGFLVRTAGAELRVPRPDEAADGWQPVRRTDCDGAPDLALDDLDPYRDCFGTPAGPRLTLAGAAGWSRRFAETWSALRAAVPVHAADAAARLTTVTPLAAGEPAVGRHGHGAIGVSLPGLTPGGLLRAVRRTKLRALLDVTDLYAQDGSWLHRVAWRQAPVPVSELLSCAYEGVALAAYGGEDRARTLAHTRQALEALEGAAELTVSGRSLVAALWGEWEETARG